MNAPVFQHEEKVDSSNAGQRLDAFLLSFPYSNFNPDLSPSRNTLQKWIADRCVLVNGEINTNKSYRVRTGDIVGIEVAIKPQTETPPPEDLDIPIIYQDKYILVIDKPPGITSHPVPWALTGSVVNFLYYKKIPLPPTGHPLRPGIVHRLDKYSSGLMVIACTDKAASTLIEMIKRREVERLYQAIVYGNPPLNLGTIEKSIGRHHTDRKKMAVVRDEKGKSARTHFRVLTRYPGFSLIGCKLDTGRTHQIRVHMSHIGYPVAGDMFYGGRRAGERVGRVLGKMPKRDPDFPHYEKSLGRVAEIITSDKTHLLHAAKLNFPHPITGEQMSFRAEPHRKFTEVLGLLEGLPHEETGNAL